MSAGWRFWSALATAVGAVLWVAYGVFEMLRPWGEAVVYREDLGYEAVTDTTLYFIYNLPGSVALILTTLGLLGYLTRRNAGPATGTRRIWLAYLALGIGILSMLGVLIQFVPIFFAGIVFGPFILGAVTIASGIVVRRLDGVTVEATVLLFLGLLGLFMVPLRPLVYAIQVMPEAIGVAIMGLYGVAWLGVGYLLWTDCLTASTAGGSRRSAV